MPEMPEVEIIRRILEPQIAGKKIETVEILHNQIIAHPDMETFTEILTGQTITNMSRKGKFLTIHFKSGDNLALHLRMTGRLLVMPKDTPVEKHTHLLIYLEGGNQLRYIDVRRFGRFWYLKKDETDDLTGQDKLGLEPLDEKLTSTYLKEKLGKKKKSIKDMLHDQSIIAGIGNIYSDEILYAAGIYPETKCTAMDDEEWDRLAKKIPEIIAWGIDTNEMKPEEYLEGKGKEYRNIPHLRVYGRADQPCLVCQAVIEKISLGGRSSCYCPECQRKKL
ncbi:bifunctional DNA-formamidopyrimidine glycosylase/DNA-(apurinic or apyrimidinic site) lyase [Priestia endophytica]|uniref:bifunctional DNA-formamidopyrimidine glycosylase/DNA-(apurinic or apyrimidinic site) lyase n=1 Tax=Priestia endophytica TaxID=135735 RepID=UPI000DCA768A|nr:bifunctional DNA-formamidopyrimidine glycosylase/DNA-(apurinic or apyrimidinic site) lyase [Priestia endophytica]RAS80749.1 DNA-formamidopyrimidine glycosylase [Priestia endophytica]